MYKIIFTKRALKDLEALQRSGSQAFKKIPQIIEELRAHPTTGIGRPEQLKHEVDNTWSRRIDKKNRITYTINDDKVIVEVLSALGHYDDK